MRKSSAQKENPVRNGIINLIIYISITLIEKSQDIKSIVKIIIQKFIRQVKRRTGDDLSIFEINFKFVKTH